VLPCLSEKEARKIQQSKKKKKWKKRKKFLIKNPSILMWAWASGPEWAMYLYI
jgi:hypothetical protein